MGDRDPVSACMTRRAIAASPVASILEWFEFIVCGMFAVVIGWLFPPAESAVASLLCGSAAYRSDSTVIGSDASAHLRSPSRS